MVTTTTMLDDSATISADWRNSSQPLLPRYIGDKNEPQKDYIIFPYHQLGTGEIFDGYATLADWIASHPLVIIDGYSGTFWHEVVQNLSAVFDRKGLKVNWIDIGDCLKSAEEIQSMVDPFLGEMGAVWGTKCTSRLEDFFKPGKIEQVQPDQRFDINIVFGIGAALVNWPEAALIYLELPKNEIQYRMRASSITNLGALKPGRPPEMYKRFYFVDWVVLNEHKQKLLSRIFIIGDVQWKDAINWMTKASFAAGLQKISTGIFRVRPWFEAGAWGGQWMKERLQGLNKKEINYAWSFELIVPENGIVFESDGYLLEVSFDFLMFSAYEAVLGKAADVFRYEFPIRFDFLDTWDGGNLSIQCHPSLKYIRDTFGEYITQDETYYILDCKEDAKVYLGFQEDIDPDTFKVALENSVRNKEVVPVESFVQAHKAKRHDLFLIPNGTIHSAGANNLVLEISATPYIFTFKMYDWLRMDLNGEPRAINIEHAFRNLRFDRKGDRVINELISAPKLIDQGEDWQLLHLPTHEDHFYDVHRIEFDSSITVETQNSCHVLMLVEGTAVTVKTADGTEALFHFAETFVIPAAAEKYTVVNQGNQRAKLVKAFIKDNIDYLKQELQPS